MDQDGYSHTYLTDGTSLVLTPRFSPQAQEIAYLDYFNDDPRVYLLNVTTEIRADRHFPGDDLRAQIFL